jgi:hypothetical protein
MEEAKGNGAWPRRLSEMTGIIPRQRLHVRDSSPFAVHMVALSPSAESEQRYVDLLRQSIPKVGAPVLPLRDASHNDIASALWLEVGQVRVVSAVI